MSSQERGEIYKWVRISPAIRTSYAWIACMASLAYTHPSDQEMRDRLRGLGC